MNTHEPHATPTRPAVVFHSKIQRGALAAGLAVVLSLLPPQARAQRPFYRYTPIADTQPQFPYANLTQFPCQSSESRVAFEATLVGDNSVQGMFTRRGLGGVGDIADNGLGEYDSIGSDCTVNASGVVLFTALKKVQDGFESLLLRGGGGTLVMPLLSTDGTYDQFGGWQLNIQGKAVTHAHRADGSADVILTKGAGTLTGPEKIIADNGASSQFAGFGFGPSINGNNTVAFTTTRRDGSIAIVTVADDGTVTNLIDNSGPFAGFSDIDLNNNGSLAFDGSLWGGVRGVWRIDTGTSSPVLTKITDSTITGTLDFTAVSINDSGQVAYSFRDDLNGFVTTGGIGNGAKIHTVLGPEPIVLGPGTVVFNRTVASATIGRDSLNNFGQIVMHIDFFDGSQMIARAGPIGPLQNLASIAGAFALSNGTGSGSGMSTPVNLPSTLLVLAFDATFLTSQGELKVLLGDKLLKSIPAPSRGIRQRVRVPIDLRQKTRATAPLKAQELKFVISGAPGAAVHIGNISIPGAGLNLERPDAGARWHFDTQSGGWAGFVDATRFPVQITVLTPEPKGAAAPAGVTSVAILSTASFDATRDIQRDTLHFAGLPVRLEPEESREPKKKGDE